MVENNVFAFGRQIILVLPLLLLLLTTSSGDVNINSMGTPIGYRIIGVETGGKSGYSVSAAGDVNKDGVGDVIIGAFDSASAIGISYVIFGRNKAQGVSAFDDIQLSGASLAASVGFRILGANSNDVSGLSVSAAGDVNKDGIADIIVGAPGADPYTLAASSNAGMAYVIFGRNIAGGATPFGDIQLTTTSTAMNANFGFRILGAAANDELGHCVNKAGDVNGDSISDIIVSAKNALGGLGITYVIYGRNIAGGAPAFGDIVLTTTALSAIVGFRILGAIQSTGYSGFSVSGAGDVNQDGIDDVVIGSFSAYGGVSNRGICYVVFGRNIAGGAAAFGDVQLPSDTMDANVGFRIIGPISSDRVGNSVSGAGDVNGDGIADLLLGMDNVATSGKAYVVFGRNIAAGAPLFGDIFLPSATMSASVGFRILGLATGDQVGYSVSGAGDVNGDGWADILIGAVGTGDAYIIYGRNYPGGAAPFGDITVTTGANVMPTDVGFRIIGTSTSQVGISVKAAGDINGDGVADVIVGAPYADPPAGTDVGISYIFCGQAIIKPTSQPSGQPSGQPSRQPSRQPSSQPSRQPSSQPTRQPTAQPSRKPSTQPSMQPSRQPSSQPSSQPSRQPSVKPSTQPSNQPSRQPSQQPFAQPSKLPTAQPSGSPTMQPSRQPSAQPSRQPSGQPSRQPSVRPSSLPSCQPSCQPSMQPTTSPSTQPSAAPSAQPSKQPSIQPSEQPSVSPSRQPSSQPSGLPTIQPITRPSSQPSMQPSSQPTSQPALQPSMQPSMQPSCQPIAQPTLQPITSPSTQPTSTPSVQPTDKPTLQPSAQPSHVPSVQPTSTPSGLPSSQPSSQPSARPTAQPSEQPTAYPTAQPSIQPSMQPSGQPSTTPSAQPTMQPSSQPVSDPTCQPSSTPTVVPTQLLTAREYVYLMHANSTSSRYSMARIGDVHWMCGKEQSVSSCAAVASPGKLQSKFEFDWGDITSVIQTDDPSVVMVSGRTLSADTMITDIARCVMGTELQCAVRSYSASNYVAVSFSPSVHKLVYTGSSGGYASVLMLDSVTSAASTYQYTSETMQSIAMTLVQSPPNFLGSFIAGTCTSVGSVTSIFAGMVRTDTGAMTAMYMMPTSGTIVNSAELVNAMALEHTQPDSFIGGGLQTTGEASVSAYVLRVNALYQSVLNGWRYRIYPSAVGGRRKLTVETVSNSVVKGLAIVEAELYVLVSWNTSTAGSLNCISILRTDLASGAIQQQVHIKSNSSSLSCTEMNYAGIFLTIACSMLTPTTGATRALLVSADRQLTFSKLPTGFERHDHVIFSAESVAFQRTKLVLSAEKVTLATTDYAFSTADETPTLHPTIMTTRSPTVPPSVIPSAQPSSSPTTTPSVSPQPTSQPSSSGPTNTYKPTVNPTPRPSMAPSNTPTVVPTPHPTVAPTARPTVQPSRHPSAHPTVVPTTAPSLAPHNKPTIKPSALPSITPSCQPSGASTTVTPSVMAANPVRSEDNDGNDNIALVIGGSIAGGLVLLWCGHKLIKWSVQSFDNYKQKRGMQSILDTNQLQRAKEISLQRHVARASGAYLTSRLSVTAAKTTARVSTTAAAVSSVTSSGGDPNNINGKSPVCRDQDDEIASESSVMLSSLHSSELSYMDEDGNSVYSSQEDAIHSDETPEQFELPTLSHVRSRESLMEEGSVVCSLADSGGRSSIHHSEQEEEA